MPIVRNVLLTKTEVAECLRLTLRTLSDYLRRGELRGRLIGRRWRFTQEDVDAFLKAREVTWNFPGSRDQKG